MIGRLIIGLVLAFSVKSFCTSELDSLVNAGLRQSYNFDFEKSSQIFNEIIDKYPDHPEGYYYLSQNHLWFYLGTRDEGELKTFENFTELALEKCDDVISREGESAYYTGLLGNLALQEAMVAASEESTLSAFFSTKSAYGYFEDALELDSSFYKAYLGLGLLEYALSYVPGVFKWAIDITGLGRDKEKGFRYICMANDNADGLISETESSFHKSKMLAEYMGDTRAAIDILDTLVHRFPRNLLFKYQLALALIDYRELEKAESNLKYILENPDQRFIQTVAFSYFLMGEIKFRNNDFKESISLYEKFLEMSRGFEYSGMAYYNIALSWIVLGNELEAKKNLVLARNGNSDISDDVYAARKSGILYENMPDEVEIELIRGKNNLVSGDYGSVISVLLPVEKNLSGEKLVECRLLLAEAEYFRGNYTEAEEFLSKIDINSISIEDWLIPYYFYLQTVINLKLQNREAARVSLIKAKEYNEYDFKEKILAKLNYLKSLFSK